MMESMHYKSASRKMRLVKISLGLSSKTIFEEKSDPNESKLESLNVNEADCILSQHGSYQKPELEPKA
jgi:hypothetical protein